jgi:hypothetical protein
VRAWQVIVSATRLIEIESANCGIHITAQVDKAVPALGDQDAVSFGQLNESRNVRVTTRDRLKQLLEKFQLPLENFPRSAPWLARTPPGAPLVVA